MGYLQSTVGIFIDVNYTKCRICNIYAATNKYAINMHFHSNMQKYVKQKINHRSTDYEKSTFIIKIILGEL